VTNMVERLSLISTPHEQLGLTVPPLLVAGADGLTSVDGACCICSRQQLALGRPIRIALGRVKSVCYWGSFGRLNGKPLGRSL
jgi:hypothetical protein